MKFSQFLVVVLSLLSISPAYAAWNDFAKEYGYDQQQRQSAQPYNRSGDSYSRSGETLKGGSVIDAIVISVRQVTMEASSTTTNVGTGAGAAVGGIAGASVGSNSTTKLLGGLLGGLAGGLLGDFAGTSAGEDDAGEIVVMLENGQKLFLVQKDGMQFKEGQRVFLLSSAGDTQNSNLRVSPNPAYK